MDPLYTCNSFTPETAESYVKLDLRIVADRDFGNTQGRFSLSGIAGVGWGLVGGPVVIGAPPRVLDIQFKNRVCAVRWGLSIEFVFTTGGFSPDALFLNRWHRFLNSVKS